MIAGMLKHLADCGHTWQTEKVRAWAIEFAEGHTLLRFPFGELPSILKWLLACAEVVGILGEDDYARQGQQWADEAINHYSGSSGLAARTAMGNCPIDGGPE